MKGVILLITLGYSATNETIEMYSNNFTLTNLLLRNAEYDYCMITQDTIYPVMPTSQWTYDTLLLAEFQNNCNASNVDFSVENTSELLMKRRKKDSTDPWYIVHVQSIQSSDDFNFITYDRFAAANTFYEYAIVPIINGAQGEIITQEVFSDFYGIRLLDKNICYKNIVEDTLSYKRFNSTGVVNTMAGKYPYVINNSENNYNYGSLSTIFLQIKCNKEQEEYMEDFEYRRKLIDFLTNHKAKVLKKFTGEIFLIKVDGDVSMDDGDSYMMPTTSFEWLEIGDTESNADMYSLGLSDVLPDWYNLVNSTADVGYNNLMPSIDIDTSILRWKLVGSTNIPNNNNLTWNLL